MQTKTFMFFVSATIDTDDKTVLLRALEPKTAIGKTQLDEDEKLAYDELVGSLKCQRSNGYDYDFRMKH